MRDDVNELIAILSELAELKALKVTVQKSGEGAVVCGLCSFAGGLALGPAGLLLGSLVGGVLGFNRSKGTFRSLGDVIRNDLSDTQKEKLVRNLINVVKNIRPEDYMKLILLIMTNTSAKETVLKEVIRFLSKELKITIVNQ